MFTENQIRSLTTPQTYSRGQDYFLSGAVGALVRRGNTLTAEVEGSHGSQYQVMIELDDVDASCTCPYDGSGCCKHIIAVLLTASRTPDAATERPTIETLLAGLDAVALRGLLVDLLTRQPDLVAWVETRLALAGTPATKTPQKPPVDTQVVHRLVRGALRTSHEYFATTNAVNALNSILNMADNALDNDDATGALAIAEILAAETIPRFEEFDDSDGEFGEWFDELGAVAAEAVLSLDLTTAERAAWIRKFKTWQDELGSYGIDDAFDLAIATATYGWDTATVRKKLAGQAPTAGRENADEAYADVYEDEDQEDDDEADFSWLAKKLNGVRLNVLARQGRIDEFLNLAAAAGEVERYATMLVTAGRLAEAVDYGLHELRTPGEILALAKALHQAGDPASALRVAEHGLGLPDRDMRALAPWLRDLAETHGDRTLALRAARQAFLASSTLVNYQAAKPLAADNWPTLKAELLAHLATLSYTYEGIDIYLSEGMVDAAIGAIDKQSYTSHEQIAKVARAAVQSHPDWVIRRCQQQAEFIMNAGKADLYASAFDWLQLAKQAYQAAGRSDEFQRYVDSLLAQHSRKYKLVPLLRKL